MCCSEVTKAIDEEDEEDAATLDISHDTVSEVTKTIDEEDAVTLDIGHDTLSSGNNEMHHCYNFIQSCKQMHPCNAKRRIIFELISKWPQLFEGLRLWLLPVVVETKDQRDAGLLDIHQDTTSSGNNNEIQVPPK